MTTDLDWDALDAGKFADETAAVKALLADPPLDPQAREAVRAEAETLVRQARRAARRQGVLEGFLQEFSLSKPEGLALMCLAEALLRTPDEGNRDRLIAETIGQADWASHLGKSPSLFVNASTWGLMLTGKLLDIEPDTRRDFTGFLSRLTGRLGEPVIRAAVARAVRIMGEQFVLGRTIEAALERARVEGMICSFDMLGEGARTQADAERYEAAYAEAIAAIGRTSHGRGPETGHGVSVKLSALSPRYEPAKEDQAWRELYPRLLRLAELAAAYNLNFTLDAEEADRLVLSLKLLNRLTREPSLGSWKGLGLAVQAYQKRSLAVVRQLDRLARDTGRRLMVRLVKGAYWDSEIKHAQVLGRPGYPVFTTKAATDLSYLATARALIAASPRLYPQFATHNAHTLAAVHRMALEAEAPVEFQRLHGMGEALYQAAGELLGPVTLRAYAPVGAHEDLLPYLVRRLLENGANTSFVHQLLDEKTPPDHVIADPIAVFERDGPGPHPRIPLPVDLYGDRRNSLGADLSIAAERDRLSAEAKALVLGPSPPEPSIHDLDAAFAAARAAQPAWDGIGGPARAQVLRAMADALEADADALVALVVREAGKTLADGVAEVREAADYCRYYALLAERDFGEPQALKGPAGETNTLERHGRGVFVCISPWNFPLAIFTGQVVAALAAGNAVLAKPAEQTPRIAAGAVALFHQAGLDPALLTLTPGSGETLGAALVAHPACAGVAFTGGTQTACAINRRLAQRKGPIVPFIAETGGLNGLFVDTTAQREQVIDDVIVSAFGSSGQRCSSLRLLFLPHATADSLIEGIMGAMEALVIGDPADPATDVGPIIDGDALKALKAHEKRLAKETTVLKKLPAPRGGTFFGPVLAEIPHAGWLDKEVFGPILHVVRYDPDDLDGVADALASKGYGLTLGVHSRLAGFADAVRRRVPAGNCYVNRSIIGAVVGVQPFGGEGLSGTGPKAGGPRALDRYSIERAVSINTTAQGGDPALLNL